jgi:glycine/D-amino acid oxidase-like deaminating enzyme
MGCWGRNIYGLSGCNASGILKMTALGRLLAERMAGMDSSLLREADLFCRPTFIPPDPVRRLAVAAAIRKLNRQVARP